MTISLRIPGDPAAIHAAADWLNDQLYGATLSADQEMLRLLNDASLYWTGESGMAFGSAIQTVRRANLDTPPYMNAAAPVLHAYAKQLEWAAESFVGLKSDALDAGLDVVGDVVQYPSTWLWYRPNDVDVHTPVMREWAAHERKVAAYQDISKAVGTFWGDLEAWVAEHFGGLVGQIADLSDADTAYNNLVEGEQLLLSGVLTYGSERVKLDLASFRSAADELQASAKAFTQGLKSGNPAIKAAAIAADPKALRAEAYAMSEAISGVSKSAKIIPAAGVAIDIIATGVEIADGESPSTAIAGFAGGTAAGAAAAGVGAVLAAPVTAVTVGVVAAGYFGGQGSRWAWEHWVPIDSREALDHGDWDYLAQPFAWEE